MSASSSTHAQTPHTPQTAHGPHGAPPTLCVGAAHWDLIARADGPVSRGDDVPGAIRRAPGGVALNIALGLAHRGFRAGLCAVIGEDGPGRDIIALMEAEGIERQHMVFVRGERTGAYLAIEDEHGELVAAVADTTALDGHEATLIEAARAAMESGAWGRVAIEANLSAPTLFSTAILAREAALTLIVNPASPAKAVRLAPLLAAGLTPTILANKAEVDALIGAQARDAAEAARALTARGAAAALVTDGPRPAALAVGDVVCQETPEPIEAAAGVGSVTGAGDAAIAAFLALADPLADPPEALHAVLLAARRHLEGAS